MRKTSFELYTSCTYRNLLNQSIFILFFYLKKALLSTRNVSFSLEIRQYSLFYTPNFGLGAKKELTYIKIVSFIPVQLQNLPSSTPISPPPSIPAPSTASTSVFCKVAGLFTEFSTRWGVQLSCSLLWLCGTVSIVCNWCKSFLSATKQ